MRAVISIAVMMTVLVFSASSKAQSADSEIKRELVGVWQNSEGVGSGLSDHYQFFDDGRFRFNYNEMDGTKRVLSYSGFWNVYKRKLHLHANRITVHLGGKWIKSTGSIATEYEIVGGKVMRKRIAPIEKLTYRLSAITLDDETYRTLIIGEEKFWKLSADPLGYEN